MKYTTEFYIDEITVGKVVLVVLRTKTIGARLDTGTRIRNPENSYTENAALDIYIGHNCERQEYRMKGDFYEAVLQAIRRSI